MRLLITRPAEDAAPLAGLLRDRGHEVVQEPLLEIVPLSDSPLDLDGVAALLFTSANGVRCFAHLSSDRSLPVFAVGDRTAEAAREAGFSSINSANGDVSDLAALVNNRLRPSDGALLHPAASQVAGDLKGLLEEAGFEVRRRTIYEAKPATSLTPSVIEAFLENRLDGVLFFSPRTAEAFASLAKKANIEASFASVTAFALSHAVAEHLAPLSFKAVRIALRPEQESLLACIDEERMTSDVETTEPPVLAAKPKEETPGPIRSTRRAIKAFLLGGVLGIALVAGAGGVLWPVLVDALKREMAADEPVQAPPSEDVALSVSRLEGSLSKRIEALETKSAVSPPGAVGVSADELGKLAERLAKLETELQTVAARREMGPALLVSVLVLREAGSQGRPFASELEALERLGGKDEEIASHAAALKNVSEKGVVPLAALERRFQAVKSDLLRSTQESDEGLWQAILRRLSVLISIRRTDVVEQETAGLDGAVARAEASLEKRDLSGMVAALSPLSGPAGEVIRPWLGEASAHIEAGQHMDALLKRALALAAAS